MTQFESADAGIKTIIVGTTLENLSRISRNGGAGACTRPNGGSAYAWPDGGGAYARPNWSGAHAWPDGSASARTLRLTDEEGAVAEAPSSIQRQAMYRIRGTGDDHLPNGYGKRGGGSRQADKGTESKCNESAHVNGQWKQLLK